MWQRALGGGEHDCGYTVDITPDTCYVVIGYSYSNNYDVSGHHASTCYSDYWLVKLNRVGEIVRQRSLGGTRYDYGYFVQAVFRDTFVIAGTSNSTDGDISGRRGGGFDCWVVKLVQESLEIEQNNNLQRPFVLNIFPNPFNSSCIFASPVELKIELYDINGAKVDELRNGEKIWMPDDNLPNGIYLVKATSRNNRTMTKSVLYVK